MTQEQIIAMAREAGFIPRHNNPNEWWMLTGDIERFYQLTYNKALEDAAKTLRNVDALHAAGLVDVTIDAIRNMKDKP